ncbi:MAG TPA: SrtB family sortase, partial [Coriobacteriia bacterium]|nr:SrtB family sortase [Coriobacteriia bacterium]
RSRSMLDNYAGPSAAGLERVNSRVQRRAAGAHSKASAPSSKILLIAGAALILVALVIALFLIYRYTSADQKNDSFVEAAGLDPQTEVVADDADPNAISINWEALRRINSDVVGWIMIPGTRVNYPIVQTVENEYYLTHMFDKSVSDSGAIFLDYEANSKLQGKNNMMYGHNMLDGSMFAALSKYQDQAFFDSHRTILLFTPEKNYKLEVVSVLLCEAQDKIRQVNFADDTAYRNYVNLLLGYSVINTIDATAPPTGLYSLATCTGVDNSKRFVVLAKDTGEVVTSSDAAQPTDGGSDPAAAQDGAASDQG